MNTKNYQKEFSKESIDIYLKKLSKVYKKLSAGRMPAEIILVGGSAIAVNYSFRQSSTDIDAIIQAPDVMRDAIFRIRDEENLPNDWINSDFTKTASFSPMLRLYSKHYRTFSNIVEIRTITGALLIAMTFLTSSESLLRKTKREKVQSILPKSAMHAKNFTEKPDTIRCQQHQEN